MSDCEHKHTGSCSPKGVYLYVICMDCGDLLAMSDEGRKRLSECEGYNPARGGLAMHSQDCQNCGFGYWPHVEGSNDHR